MYGGIPMLLILPAAFAALLIYIKQKIKEGPKALATAILVFELLLLAITNLLSVTKLLVPVAVFVSWLAVFFVCVLLYVKNGGDFRFVQKQNKPVTSVGSGFGKADTGFLYKIMIGILVVLSVVLFVGAVFTVPYNYDSMSYHLARIGYWIDHQSVEHYICNIDGLIYSPVFAEYNLLHMMLLGGNDTFVNFLQYISMFGAAYFIFHSIRALGTNRTFSMFGTFVFMTMPLTISQSITTQNDLFVTVFFAIFVYLLIDVIRWEKIIFDKEQAWVIFLLSLTVGFSYLAKTSVCASMVFFMPWLLIVRLTKKDKFINLLKSVGVAIGGIGLTVSETWIRTYISGGSIMMDTASGDIMVATKNVAYIIVNILKNFSMLITQHICRPLNGFVYRIAVHTGQALGVEVNSEAIAFHGFDFLHHMNMGDDMYSHDKTPSAFAAYLAVAAGVMLVVLLVKLIVKRKKVDAVLKAQWKLSLGYAVSAWLSFGFIMALLRWQPWGTRLMYPALAMTVIAGANLLWLFIQGLQPDEGPEKCTAKPFAKRTVASNIVLSVLIVLSTVLAIPSVTYNMDRAMEFMKNGCEDRRAYYFLYNQRRVTYEQLASLALAEEAEDIGLIISGDGYDYPLWLVFREDYPEGKLRHILVEHADNADAVAPDAILMVERDVLSLGDTYEYGGETYICTYVNEVNHDAYLSKCR